VPEDPNVQTFVLKSATPAKAVEFTVSGTGSIPREQQNAAAGQQPGMGGQAAGGDTSGAAGGPGNTPGGGIGQPIDTPDPLTKYKWWILGAIGLVFAAAAAYFLRKPAGAQTAANPPEGGAVPYPVLNSPAAKHTQLLNALKEEMFTLESEKINGSVDPEEFARVKAALEIVLKRALNRK
jgi:hypothetical protein